MPKQEYLDQEGLKKLVEFINSQHDIFLAYIELLNKTDGTPGSIQQMIDEAISKIDISSLFKDDSLIIYGGSATELIDDDDVIIYGGSATILT